MVRRDAGDAPDELPVHACAELDGGAVRADLNGRAGIDAELARVSRRELDHSPGPLELQLGHPLHGRSGEERAVGQQAQALAPTRFAAAASSAARCRSIWAVARHARRSWGSRSLRNRARRARRKPAAGRARLRRRTARPTWRSTPARRDRAGSPRGAGAGACPRGSCTCRRARGSSCPGRRGSVQPAIGARNIEIASTLSARSASARTSGFAAASSPETMSSSIGSGSASSRSAAAAQASATPRPFAVSSRWKAPLPGLSASPSSRPVRRPSRRRGRRGPTGSGRSGRARGSGCRALCGPSRLHGPACRARYRRPRRRRGRLP